MTTRGEALAYGLSFPDTYQEAPFHDENWQLVRVKGCKKVFLWTYERNGYINLNVKVSPEWRDLWRSTYSSVIAGWHQNKEHWNTIILDGTIPEEEIKRAREITAIEYLKKYQPNRLKKSSARNEWELTDHDSFKINEQTSQWHWKSRDIGGTSALNFLIHVDGCSFLEAVQMLKDEYPTYIPPPVEAKPKKPFVLPTASPDCRRVFRYLKERGISGEVLQRCVHFGILYESLPYHNAVFIGRDENQVARYAFLRGIYDASGKSFKMEQAGSEKAYAFCVPAKSGCRRVAVYEACVDVLAHMTLEQRQGSRDKYRLELGGISSPKEGQSQRSMKKPQALEHFLSQHPEITEIEVCTDNDFAGRWACEHIRKAYEGSYRIIENLPEIEGADWADMAKMDARTPEKRQNREAR